jgi:hypothetical protein
LRRVFTGDSDAEQTTPTENSRDHEEDSARHAKSKICCLEKKYAGSQGRSYWPPLVGACDANKRRARSQASSIRQERPIRNCEIAEEVSRAEQAAQGHALPIGDVDAELLHQPRRKELARATDENAGSREDRTPQGFRPHRIAQRRRFCPPRFPRYAPCFVFSQKYGRQTKSNMAR